MAWFHFHDDAECGGTSWSAATDLGMDRRVKPGDDK
jgi:hypothetical protein